MTILVQDFQKPNTIVLLSLRFLIQLESYPMWDWAKSRTAERGLQLSTSIRFSIRRKDLHRRSYCHNPMLEVQNQDKVTH